MEVFNDYAYYYNAFYGDKDYEGEARVIDQILRRYCEYDIKSILNMGCGTGNHDRELCKIGNYAITGIDLSSKMIEIAKEKIINCERTLDYKIGDIREYRDGILYDAVISLFHVMSYQNSNEDFSDALKTAHKHLKKDGIFLFDAWYGPGVLTDRPAVRIKTVDDGKNMIVRYANPVMNAETNIVDVNYDVLIIDKITSVCKKIYECHSMRYVFRPEVEYLLNSNGFELIDCLDCNTLEKPDYNSWTAYFVAKNRG